MTAWEATVKNKSVLVSIKPYLPLSSKIDFVLTPLFIVVGKKPRTKSKDLRKKLGTLSVLEMAQENAMRSPNKGTIPPELLESNFYGSTPSVRSDPTVLKSLRAFRPNAHKPKPDDIVKSLTQNCYDTKAFCQNLMKNAFNDCNENSKFSTLAFNNADLEMHFRTSGVKTKKYNDFYNIKEDLMSVSNIPNIANHATVNVVHSVHDPTKPEDTLRSQNVQSTTSESPFVSTPSTSITRNADSVASNQKMKTETQGSHVRKPSSSQPSSQNAEINVGNSVSTSTKTILSSVLSRSGPAPRIGVAAGFNNLLAAITGPDRIVTQPQYVAIVNRNNVNQTSIIQPQNPNLTSSSVTAAGNIRSANQNVITQSNKPPVQSPRPNVAPQSLTRLLLEGERPNVISGRSYAVQNLQQGRIAIATNQPNIISSSNSNFINASKYVSPTKPSNQTANSGNLPKSPTEQNAARGKLLQRTTGDRVIFQTNVSNFSRNSPQSPSKVNPQTSTIGKNQEGANAAQNPLTSSQTDASSLILDGRSSSPAVTSTVSNFENRTFTNSPYSEVVNIMQDISSLEGNSRSVLESGTAVLLSQPSSPSEGVTTLLNTSPVNFERRLESPKTIQSRNILSTVLKRNATNKVAATTNAPQYSIQNVRTGIGEAIQNVMVSQSSSRNTIHYTVVNPSSIQQNALGDGLNSMAGDMVERVVKHDDYASPRSVMSPLTTQINNSSIGDENPSGNPEEGSVEEVTSVDGQQIVIVPRKSSPSQSVQSDANNVKKTVINNQTVARVVRNNGDASAEVLDNAQPNNNKLSELLSRDDQRTCITVRAIKRTQSDSGADEIPNKIKGSQSQNGEQAEAEESKNGDTSKKAESNTSEPMCQYLVLEAVNDPSGSLPKFNQAFGKPYQVCVKT